ncbi:MAG: S41 family peptidase [Candidatus Moranbacteria bacterium CG10_big_fil_rev_8_21_14_0_10_35_21]|nr:MAG: S41 family peptidase [Candidatus Moranbacteria bacterium CG10_big_fil_rev_8_21_14_0_10_35_21]PJA88602.1 MAG: S41 family peptidase [Candidatus Moranbacteria bacterium CG_4_9_14_3_um_filter_36_9]
MENNLPECGYKKTGEKFLKKYLSLFFTLFLIVAGYGIGYEKGKSSIDDSPKPIISTNIANQKPTQEQNLDFSLYWKAWDLVKEKYVGKNSIDAQKLLYGSINGMLKATGDPYMNFFDPEETKIFNQDMEGSFEGIGAELGIKDDILTIIAPLDESPAQKAGLRAGDKILKIGEKLTSDTSIDEAVDLIRGKKGTEIKLTVLHQGQDETEEISIIRDVILVASVKLEFKEDNLAYLKINKFGEDTFKEFSEAVNKILSHNSPGLIIDLRNNPGGFLDQTVKIAGLLLPRNSSVVIEEDYAGKKETLKTSGGDKLSSLPTVILINEGSASASEILAGALHDNLGTQIIGKKSFGKGTVQELISLPTKTSIKITVAKWLTPKENYIDEKGINPDIEIDLSLDDFKNNRDPQMEKALEILKEKIN